MLRKPSVIQVLGSAVAAVPMITSALHDEGYANAFNISLSANQHFEFRVFWVMQDS